MLDYVAQQLVLLDITAQLPDAKARPDQLINRATDVLSAAFCYLDVRIRYEAHCLGIFGKTSSISRSSLNGSRRFQRR